MSDLPRGFLPVTTFGPAYPLDRLIQPFLSRHVQAVMVSYHYAKDMPADFPLAAFIDSGGFAAILPGSRVIETPEGLGTIERVSEDCADIEIVHPDAVHALQVAKATYGSPLDFPVPPSMGDAAERVRRLRLTLANARYVIELPRPERLTLFGAVQGWDVASYVACARELQAMGYRHLAIGGLVPRLGDLDLVERIVRAVRALQSESSDALHLFGLGHPDNLTRAFAWGATSTDSSSYVQYAARGQCWAGEMTPTDPSPLERSQAALRNLEACVRAVPATANIQPASANLN